MEEGIEGIFNVIQKEQQNVARTTSVNLVAESSAEYIAESREKKKNMQISDMMVRSDNTVEEQVGMQIVFGRNMISGQPVIWEPNDTNQLFHTNMGIIGTMGTGKTQFTKSLITQLYCEQNKNIGNDPLGILIFDYKGDYNESKMDFVTTTKAKILKPYHLLPSRTLQSLFLSTPKQFLPQVKTQTHHGSLCHLPQFP